MMVMMMIMMMMMTNITVTKNFMRWVMIEMIMIITNVNSK